MLVNIYRLKAKPRIQQNKPLFQHPPARSLTLFGSYLHHITASCHLNVYPKKLITRTHFFIQAVSICIT